MSVFAQQHSTTTPPPPLTHLIHRGAVARHGVWCPFRQRQRHLKEMQTAKHVSAAAFRRAAAVGDLVLWLWQTCASLRTLPLRPRKGKTGCSRSAPRRCTCSLWSRSGTLKPRQHKSAVLPTQMEGPRNARRLNQFRLFTLCSASPQFQRDKIHEALKHYFHRNGEGGAGAAYSRNNCWRLQ